MAFQINGQTVINNSRVASSMTGIPSLAHAETTWNGSYINFGGFGSYAAGEVNFVTESIQPYGFTDFNNLYISITPNLISNAGSTFGGNVTLDLKGNVGGDAWTIIPSSHAVTIYTRVIIAMRKANDGLHIETWLTPSNFSSSYSAELNLQDARWLTPDNVFDGPSESFNSIVIDWPSWGGGTNMNLVHDVRWR